MSQLEYVKKKISIKVEPVEVRCRVKILPKMRQIGLDLLFIQRRLVQKEIKMARVEKLLIALANLVTSVYRHSYIREYLQKYYTRLVNRCL